MLSKHGKDFLKQKSPGNKIIKLSIFIGMIRFKEKVRKYL